jgi:hypothetical protein
MAAKDKPVEKTAEKETDRTKKIDFDATKKFEDATVKQGPEDINRLRV